ncbi:hypothetical protein [Chryseobacterium sp.]|uniref:hypothetical protein n=1 Tax=Chryseobacterium sp. TaxID=1871047 RepID=UPI00260AC4BD|nr:hypothetical protein [Chryseobacterium sp.]
MKFFNFKNLLIVSLFLLNLISCKNSSTNEFDEFVINSFNHCHTTKECTVNLTNLPFRWDRFYIFSENHYPEALTKEEISSILGIKYNKNISLNDRLIVFLLNGEIVYEIFANYNSENLIDSNRLLVDFYLDKKAPPFFERNNAEFIIKKTDGYYALYWRSNK